MEGRIQFKIYLDRKIAENFRSLIQQKYQYYQKGLLSYEVEMALRYWMSLHTQAQNTTDIKKPNPTPHIYLVFNQVKDYLLKNYYTELKSAQQIPTKHLEEAIIATRGSDKRTLAKWLRTFHKMGLIKPVTSATWELM